MTASGSIGDIIYLIVSLTFVIGLIILTLFWLKKSKILLTSKIGKKGYNIEILSTTVLAQNRYVTMVKVKDDIFLLGVSEGAISKLHMYKENDFNELVSEDEEK